MYKYGTDSLEAYVAYMCLQEIIPGLETQMFRSGVR